MALMLSSFPGVLGGAILRARFFWASRQSIGWALHAAPSRVEHMRVRHRHLHVPMAEQFLDSPSIVIIFKEMGRTRVLRATAGSGLADAHTLHRRQRGHHPPGSRSVRLVSHVPEDPAARRAERVQVGKGPEWPPSARLLTSDRHFELPFHNGSTLQ